jgi:signal peptide peptidase SppA
LNAETFSGLWYINEPFARRMESIMIPRLVAGLDPIPAQFKPNSAINIFDEDGDFNPVKYRLSQYLKTGGGDVAVIPLVGAMSRFGLCGEGNEFLTQVLQEAAAEKSVKAVVMKGHTPGGTVDSVESFADAIKNFPKPIVGYVAGMVASAGVFAMSQCDSIVMEDAVMAEIGSIGVLQVYVNQQAALEKAGIDVRIFRAGESVDKARVNGVEPLTDDLLAEIQSDLDACMKAFKGYVRRGRAGKLTSDEVFTGRMYKKKEALNLGLIDRIGSLEDAIKLARRL